MREVRLSIPEMVVAVATLAAATVATTVTNSISGDALVALYGSVLGYVFGRARTGVETASNGEGGARSLAGEVAKEALPMVREVSQDRSERNKERDQQHTVPGTESEK